MNKDLRDTPFSIERLFVWTLGVTFLLTTLTICILAFSGREIDRPLQSLALAQSGAVTMGAATARRGGRNE